MIKWAIYRLHWLLGITAGVVLSVMGVTGATMAFEDEIMTASSHGIVDVPARPADRVLSPDELLARFREQSPDSIPVKLTLFPESGKSARLVYRLRSADAEEDNTDGTWLNPYTGSVLGKAVGERFFDTVRSLHRYLLLPHDRAGVGRPITTYVQHRLEEAASQVLSWVRRDGATIFVCGGLKMGRAVHAVLQKVLGESHLDAMAAAGHYRRDVY